MFPGITETRLRVTALVFPKCIAPLSAATRKYVLTFVWNLVSNSTNVSNRAFDNMCRNRENHQPHIEQVGNGSMSITAANEIANSMVRSGTAPPSVQLLASLGAHGTRPSNLERDLRRHLQNHHGSKESSVGIVSITFDAHLIGKRCRAQP